MKIKTRGRFEDTREIRNGNRRVGAAVQGSVPTMFCLGFFKSLRWRLNQVVGEDVLDERWRLKEIEANKQFQGSRRW